MNIGDMLGGSSGNTGSAGMNYNADKANIIKGFDEKQINNAYGQTQSGLDQQQAFLNALSAQGGIQNQSAVFGQQQALAGQLQGIANGTGPNPALQQLQNTTGTNVANQAALMAGQRGSGANAGLLARQAAMQGANTQQQAVGQGAALAAQQQLSGLGALQQQQSNMANLATNQVGQQAAGLTAYNSGAQQSQNNLLGALAQYNNANVSMQSNVNNANAGISGITAQGQQGLQGGLLSGVSSALTPKMARGGMIQNFDEGEMVKPAETEAPETPEPAPPQQATISQPQAPVQQAPTPMQATPVAPQQAPTPVNGIMSKAGQILASGAGSGGSASPGSGPTIGADSGAHAMEAAGNALGNWLVAGGIGSFIKSGVDQVSSILGGGGSSGGGADASAGAGDIGEGAMLAAAKGGEVPHFGGGGIMGEVKQMAPMLLALLNHGGGVKKSVDGEALAAQGKVVPGKAKVKGDSLKNDKVPAMLSPKEIVIPRSITMSENAPEKAKQFVAQVLAKNAMGRKRK